MLVAGRDREGADDWMRGMLAGLGGDPDVAYSGDYVWGNDLGGEINGENYNGQYQNDKYNRMYTPLIHQNMIIQSHFNDGYT